MARRRNSPEGSGTRPIVRSLAATSGDRAIGRTLPHTVDPSRRRAFNTDRRRIFNTTLQRAAIGSIVLIACLLVLYGHEIADGGRMLSGDMFDGRIADALELHWSRVFAGSEVWNRPDYFYPTKDTLGYNDGYLLFGVFLAFFRLLGVDLFVAAELAGIPFRIAGFAGIYALSREAFGLGRPLSLLAATVGVMANNIHLQQVHEQLLTVYLAPVTAFLVFRVAARARDGRAISAALHGSLAALLVSLWALTAFYTLWFTAFFGALAILAALALRPSRLRVALRAVRRASVAAPLLLASLGLIPFLLVYEPTRKLSSGHPWIESFVYTLPVGRLLDVTPGNLLASLFGAPNPVVLEYSVGLPPTLWVLATLGIAVTLLSRLAPSAASGPVAANAVRLPLALAFVVTLLLALRFGNHTAWRPVAALVPGAEAIRVVCRVMLLLGLVAGLLAAIGLEWLDAHRVPRVVTGLLGLLLVAEEVNLGGMYALPRHEEDAFLARIPPPPPACRAFVVTRPRNVAGVAPGTILGDLLTDTDAMLLAEIHSLPTPLGDASFKPPKHSTIMGERQAVLVAGGGRPVCGVDLLSGRWREVAPVIVPLAPGMLISFEEARSEDIVAGGWSPASGGARWSIGPTAELIFRWPEPAPLLLQVRARVGFGMRDHPDRVDVFADDVRLASWPNDPTFATRTLVIPRAAIGADGIVRLRLAIHAATSPAASGLSLDDRLLGIAVSSIKAE